MRITETSPARLTLEDRPWLIGSILAIAILFFLLLAMAVWADAPWLGLAFLLGAALFGVAFVAFVRRVIVIFDRAAGAMLVRTASLLGQSEATYPLSDIQRAEVETTVNRSTSSDSRQRLTSETHRTVLQVAGQAVPLTQVSSSGDGAALAAKAINDWLQA